MVVKYPPIGAIFKKKGSLPITPRVAFLLSSQFHYSHMHNSQRSSRHPCLSHVKKKKDLEMDSRMFHKTVSDSQANNGNTITRLGTESLKGLGTKACTNWEDRSANSLAYQVSNHSTFFFICWMSQSAELSSDESHFARLQRIQFCLRTCGWCAQRWYFLSEHAWRDVLPLENTAVLVHNLSP